jgi:predicted negative regulator of RcsB-dependent stress response
MQRRACLERLDIHLIIASSEAFGSVQYSLEAAMPSQVKPATIKAELKQLESALDNIADSRMREIIQIRIAELRTRLRRLQNLLRSA